MSTEFPALLANALSLPPDSPDQIVALSALTAQFEAEPLSSAVLLPAIRSIIVTNTHSLYLRRWAAHLLQFFLSVAKLTPAVKSPLAIHSLDAIKHLVDNSELDLKKVGIQCFASIYPLLFKHACSGTDQALWTSVVQIKQSILEMGKNGSVGGRIAAIKVVQRIIQTQTRGTADPRLQRTAEPNISLCRANHPFLKLGALEEEANQLLEDCITSLFTSDSPDHVSAIANSLTSLLKSRPSFGKLIVTALSNWSPAALAGSTPTQIKSVEKTFRISLAHLLKTAHANAYAGQVTDFLKRQDARMELAASEAKQIVARKRDIDMESNAQGNEKRSKVDHQGEVFVDSVTGVASENPVAKFDAKTLPLHLVVELVIASLQIIAEQTLVNAISTSRRNLPAPIAVEEVPKLESAMIDPLLDMGDDELDIKPDAFIAGPDDQEQSDDEGDAGGMEMDVLEDGTDLVAPEEMSEETKTAMMESAMRRLCAAGMEGASPVIWSPLVVRLITRGLCDVPANGEEDELAEGRREALRQIIFDFVIADLQSRMDFARLWLNEEWYVEQTSSSPEKERPYDRWLRRLLEHILSYSSNKDKAFSQFMVDLPEIPVGEVARLGELCKNPEQLQLGFSSLRELALLRPPVRQAALDVLLSLTVNPDKLTRNAAIMTVKQWVPDISALSSQVVSFAVSLLARLEIAPIPVVVEKVEEDADAMEDSPPPPPPPIALLVENGLVVAGLPTPTTLSGVTYHIELLLSLCTKSPNLLDHLFESYSRLQPFAQQSLQTLITPMIRSLGVSHPKIPLLVESFPEGSDPLVLRVLAILADKGKPPPSLVNVIKNLAQERDLSPRFYIAVLPSCNKEEVMRYLPHVVSLLGGAPEDKAIVRTAFENATIPPATFGGGGSSISRARQDELLTPVELLILLHHLESSKLKLAIESIAICFSMTEAFKPDVLASFMLQVVEEPVLPVLFMRTVIQAITTYKSLQQLVSTTLLPRLISKQVWKTPSDWEGFVRCAKITAPNSFGALLQLPQEHLLVVVTKQPTLREPLMEFVQRGGNQSEQARSLLVSLSAGIAV